MCFVKVLKDGCAVGAAVLGVPAKATIKEVQIIQFFGQNLKLVFFWLFGHHLSFNIRLVPFCGMQVNSDSLVVKTLDRKTLWEMQTPQVLNYFPAL